MTPDGVTGPSCRAGMWAQHVSMATVCCCGCWAVVVAIEKENLFNDEVDINLRLTTSMGDHDTHLLSQF